MRQEEKEKKKKRIANTIHVFLLFLHANKILIFIKNNMENTKYIPTHLSPWNIPRFDPVAPRHPVYRAFGAPRYTRSKLRSSRPSDQPADLANHSHPIVSSEIQRCTVFSGTGVPYTRSYRSIISDSLSPLVGDALSLIRSPLSGRLQPPHHHRKVSTLF